jgi:hypothetical protein
VRQMSTDERSCGDNRKLRQFGGGRQSGRYVPSGLKFRVARHPTGTGTTARKHGALTRADEIHRS